MTADERERTDQLRESPKWSLVEANVIGVLSQLYIDFCIFNFDANGTDEDGSQ